RSGRDAIENPDLYRLTVIVGHLLPNPVLRPQAVDLQPDVHAALAGLDQQVQEAISDFVVTDNVGLEPGAHACLFDRRVHRCEECLAGEERLFTVPVRKIGYRTLRTPAFTEKFDEVPYHAASLYVPTGLPSQSSGHFILSR